MHIEYWWESQKERDHWEDQGVCGRETGWDGMDWVDLVQHMGPVEGFCEQGNESSSTIKCWEILE
jgi:hypothetical protein